MEFSQQIKDFFSENFKDIHPEDIYKMSKEELIQFKKDCQIKKDEYNMLQLAMKLLGNAAYGASANQAFYFFNKKLPGDITGECRLTTKHMIDLIENFFHEEIWTRQDLKDRFNFDLDESKHEWYRSRPLWTYSDTDSAYVTYGDFFKCWDEEHKKLVETDEQKVNWILKFNQEFMNNQNFEWLNEYFNPRGANNIHEFELETISKNCIFQKKKKYLKKLLYNNGKFLLDNPKVSGVGIELVKATSPKICRKMLRELLRILLEEYDEDNRQGFTIYFNQVLSNMKKEFYAAPIDDISQSVNIGNYKKYVICDDNELLLGKQCPVSVQAIARFNYLAHKNGEDNLKQYSGKIKYYNIKDGYFGFPAGQCPSWAPKPDMKTQWTKNVIDPINRFLEVMKIPLMNAENVLTFSLFD